MTCGLEQEKLPNCPEMEALGMEGEALGTGKERVGKESVWVWEWVGKCWGQGKRILSASGSVSEREGSRVQRRFKRA
jgi:hypothetical protein